VDLLSKGLVGTYLGGLGLLGALGIAFGQDAVTTVVTTPAASGSDIESLFRLATGMGWPGAIVVVATMLFRRDKLPTLPIRMSHYHYHYDAEDEPTDHGGPMPRRGAAGRRRRELTEDDETED
jgi:hypothetical protein